MSEDNKILVVGMGCQISVILEQLKECDFIYARGQLVENRLKKEGIKDVLQVSGNDEILDDQVIEQWLSLIQENLARNKKIAYVTPISPIHLDQLADRLASQLGYQKLTVSHGNSMVIESIPLRGILGIEQLVTLDGLTLSDKFHLPFSPAQGVLIFEPTAARSLSEFHKICAIVYPPTQPLWVLLEDPDTQVWIPVSLADIEKSKSRIDAILIPPLEKGRSLEAFQDVIARLRAPDGCPWDKKQTHTSLRTYLLEETYETLDALDRGDVKGLQEELGDLILQIALHARIAEENGEFKMGDVLDGINKKIVFRHPHVFKDWQVDGETQVIQNWETLKLQEREATGDENGKGLLEGVPASFPALAQAQAIQDRAARVGFDWQEIQPVLDKVREEMDEIESAATETEAAKEFGHLMFALVNLMRWKKIDAESVLRQTNLKFRKRFSFIERSARQAGRKLNEMTLEEMDELWEKAKEFDD